MTVGLLASACAPGGQVGELNPREWELLLGQARCAHLPARLALQLDADADSGAIPAGPRVHLTSALRLAERQQHEVHWEINCIARALRPLGVPFTLLKGAAYVAARLPPARGRLFADIDIMVARPQLDAVEAALFAAGWIADERDPYNQRYYRQWMHEIPPLRHVQRNTFVDLHHTITPPTSRFRVDGAALLARVQPLDPSGRCNVLAPADMVLHSAVHLFQEGEFGHGLRDLLDLNDLLLHFGASPGFWDELLDRSNELGLNIPLFHALFHIRRLFGSPAPAHLTDRIAKLGPNGLSRMAMAWMLELALRPSHPSCDTAWTGAARWLLYVRSHALRMPWHLVIPHLLRKSWMRRFAKPE